MRGCRAGSIDSTLWALKSLSFSNGERKRPNLVSPKTYLINRRGLFITHIVCLSREAEGRLALQNLSLA